MYTNICMCICIIHVMYSLVHAGYCFSRHSCFAAWVGVHSACTYIRYSALLSSFASGNNYITHDDLKTVEKFKVSCFFAYLK